MEVLSRLSLSSSPVDDSSTSTAQKLCAFVDSSVSPFHTVETCSALLVSAGFEEISESDNWVLTPGGKYFFTRNNSTVFAFVVGEAFSPARNGGFKIVAAHTDSPCPKVRPISASSSEGYQQVSVQLYGGGLWHTWFDRDLSLGGRVVIRAADGSLVPKIVKVDRPILRIPNLAIHLQTAAESAAFAINTEVNLQPVLATEFKAQVKEQLGDSKPRHHAALLRVLAEAIGCDPSAITDFELSLFDTQPACVMGAEKEFISAPRLDNLGSCFCALQALIGSLSSVDAASDDEVRVVACFDNEECGSESCQGAASVMMDTVLSRVFHSVSRKEQLQEGFNAVDAFQATLRRSFMISSDMAHAVHPNYPQKYQENHRPKLHRGVALKHNANQRYTTDAIGAAFMRELATRNNIPIQDFVVRNDSPCGSTIGPLISARTGIKTVDLGIPQLAMHSCREFCGVDDITHCINLFKVFFSQSA